MNEIAAAGYDWTSDDVFLLISYNLIRLVRLGRKHKIFGGLYFLPQNISCFIVYAYGITGESSYRQFLVCLLWYTYVFLGFSKRREGNGMKQKCARQCARFQILGSGLWPQVKY